MFPGRNVFASEREGGGLNSRRYFQTTERPQGQTEPTPARYSVRPQRPFSVGTSGVLQAWALQSVADGSTSGRPDVSEMASLDGSDCRDLN